jgi:hypothetical protein
LKIVFPIYFQNQEGAVNKYTNVHPDFLVYNMPMPNVILAGDRWEKVGSWSDWHREGKDAHSVMTKATTGFVSQDDRFELTSSSPAAHAGCVDFINPRDARLTVARDFYGRKRAPKPSAGAFEPK